MKPSVQVTVASDAKQKRLPAATVRSSSRVETLKGGDSWKYLFDRPGDVLYVEAVNKALPVTVRNLTTVPLVLEWGFGKEKLDDVLDANKSFRVPNGARLKVSL